MSFDTEVVKDGRGRAIRVDVSVDRFSTISYRYGDVAGLLDGTNMYAARVLDLGAVRRAFGQDFVATSGSTSLVLDNADGELDWLCGAENIATASKARFRIYVVIYSPGAEPLSFTSKLLGEFSLASWPEQDNTTTKLDLADDMVSSLGPGLLLPTIRDWKTVGADTSNPLFNGFALPESITEDTPIQLAFGGDWFQAFPHVIPLANANYERRLIVPLYSTTDTSVVSQSLINSIAMERLEFLRGADGPPVTTQVQLNSGFTIEKSPTISKGGRNFQVVYLVINTTLPATLTGSTLAQLELLRPLMTTGGYSVDAAESMGDGYLFYAVVSKWFARGQPLSQRTNPPTRYQATHPVDVLTDLVSIYSSSTVDSTSAARIKAAFPTADCAGLVQSWTEMNGAASPLPMSLRQSITSLAQSSDIDVFINWSGVVAFSAAIWDFTTATMADSLVSIREEELISISRRVPSNGERHAPFNRVQFNGGRAGLVSGTSGRASVPFQGPFDVSDGDIALTDRIIEKVIEQGWVTQYQGGISVLDPNSRRIIDKKARDVVTFRTGIQGLRLELGEHFKLTWSRGSSIGGPYDASIFQCEAIAYASADDTVEVTAVWRDDITTERQYLLDDETLLVRSKGGLSGDAMFDGSNSVEFNGTINLATMGVEVGDILLLQSSAEAADAFTFNAAYRITVIPSTVTVEVVGPSGAPTLSGSDIPNAEWSIVRGATTYPTAISDPTNYPYGGDIYGKVTDASGDYSNSEQGNRLING